MTKIICKKKTYVSFIFFVCSFFLMSPVLSPKFNNEVTIYINWFIPLLDIYFVNYLFSLVCKFFKFSMKAKFFCVIAFSFLWVVFFRNNFFVLVKIITICYSVAYLQYAYQNIGFKYLYLAFNINIFVAIAQFILYLYKPEAAYVIGPENIHKLIWGSKSFAGNTNFYPIFIFPRTCGFSREAGFFAALLNIVICIHAMDNNCKFTKRQKLLYFIAYVISFSKMSILFIFMYFVYKEREKIDKINYAFAFITIFLLLGIMTNILNDHGYFSMNNESMTHRLYGYAVTFDHLNLKEILMGNSNGVYGLNRKAMNEFPFCYKLLERGFTFCGYPNIIISFGYTGLLMFLILLSSLGVTASGLIFIILSTFDVDFITATSFVVLSYWCVIYEMKMNKKITVGS